MKHNIQTNFSDGSNIFFTSDTHFNHENIMKLCNRPWDNVNDMNELRIFLDIYFVISFYFCIFVI